MADILRQLQAARQNLLDLTMRNRLLNFRPTKLKTIQLMMSPLSIAQFLDPRTARFDVIIFDEASQVRPEDALGALLRGNQVVVLGDTRQLPPTSFFDRIVETDEDEEQELTASVADMESILHQCKRS